MANRPLPAELRNLLVALDGDEKETVRQTMGIDVDTWQLDETALAAHQKLLDNHRAMVAAELKAKPYQGPDDDTTKCSGCGSVGRQVELFITLSHGTKICDKCFRLLEQHARHGK
jgi:hypothetical protein